MTFPGLQLIIKVTEKPYTYTVLCNINMTEESISAGLLMASSQQLMMSLTKTLNL